MPYTDTGTGWQGTDTSRNAALAIGPNSGTIAERVMRVMRRVNHPLTAEEISRALEIDYGSVQPRISELRNSGKIIDSGTRKLGRYGKQIVAWKVAP